MCISPILIDNPYYRSGNTGVNFLKDTTSTKIEVPCGNCYQCIAMRQGFILQRVQMESLRSHLFMFTLTYNDDSLMYVDVGEYQIAIPYYLDIQNMFKRMRKSGLKFRYLVCSEYGKRRFRPHYHGILAVEKDDRHYSLIEQQFGRAMWKEWRRNYAAPPPGKKVCKHPRYEPLFTPQYDRIRCTTFDFHYIIPIRDHESDVSFYVTKYVTKYDTRTTSLLQKIKIDPSLSDDETSYLISMIRPKRVMSKDFGSYDFPPIKSAIHSMAARESDYVYPQYFDIYTGAQMPMSPFYGKRLSNFAHLYRLFEKYSDYADDNTFFINDSDTLLDRSVEREGILNRIHKFDKTKKELFDRCDF